VFRPVSGAGSALVSAGGSRIAGDGAGAGGQDVRAVRRSDRTLRSGTALERLLRRPPRTVQDARATVGCERRPGLQDECVGQWWWVSRGRGGQQRYPDDLYRDRRVGVRHRPDEQRLHRRRVRRAGQVAASAPPARHRRHGSRPPFSSRLSTSPARGAGISSALSQHRGRPRALRLSVSGFPSSGGSGPSRRQARDRTSGAVGRQAVPPQLGPQRAPRLPVLDPPPEGAGVPGDLAVVGVEQGLESPVQHP
jgi:hypothetical protein